ncbi:MAG: type II secretion system protein N [Planctomycetota bacterium]
MAHVDRNKARRLTRIAQAAALLLVGAGAAAAVLGFDPPPPPEPADGPGWPAAVQPEDTPEPPGNEFADIEFAAIALDGAAGIEPQTEDSDDEPAPAPITPQPRPTPSGGQRYLGGLFVGEASFAVIATATGQHTLRVGDTLPGTDSQVVAIDRQAVELETRGVRETLERAVADRVQITQMSPEIAGASQRPPTRAEQNAARRNRLTRPDAETEQFRSEVERRRDAIRRQRELQDERSGND